MQPSWYDKEVSQAVHIHKPWYIKAVMWIIGVGFVLLFLIEAL